MNTETVTGAAPQQAVVLLEPANVRQIDLARAQLTVNAEATLPQDDISSPAEYSAVAEMEASIGRYLTTYEPVFDEHVAAAHKVWKQACSIRGVFIDGPKALKERARRLLGAYKDKQERIRRQEEERIRQAEQKRLEDERAAKAKQLEKAGRKEDAAVVKNTPVQAAVTTLPSVVPAVQGLTYRDEWKWRPIAGDTPDGRKKAAQVVPREYLKLDEVALNALARSMKGSVKVPGIEFWCEKVPVRR
jgi:hypothetical protein